MDAPQIDIVRGLRPAPQLRAADDTGMPAMVGHFSVFNRWYEIHSWFEGDFLERIAPGAFADTFAAHWDDNDQHRIKVMFDHGFDPQIGDKLLGRSDVLREDKTGAYYEVPLFDTSYNRDLVPGLDAGEYGASFRFRVTEEHWIDDPEPSEDNPRGMPERTILSTETREYGPVPFGANPAATAGLRSLTDDYYEALRQRRPSMFEEACRVAGREIPTGRVDPRRTTGGGSGDEPIPGDEPEPTNHLLRARLRTDLILAGVIEHDPR